MCCAQHMYFYAAPIHPLQRFTILRHQLRILFFACKFALHTSITCAYIFRANKRASHSIEKNLANARFRNIDLHLTAFLGAKIVGFQISST